MCVTVYVQVQMCVWVGACACERAHVHAQVNSVLVTGVSYAREGKAVIALSAALRPPDLIPAPLG